MRRANFRAFRSCGLLPRQPIRRRERTATHLHDSRLVDHEFMARKRQGWIYSGFMFVVAALSSCTPEPHSNIVEKVEQAGSGNLAATTTDSIQKWLAARRQLSHEVDEMCKPVRQSATAQWAESTEGRVCTAARNVEITRAVPAQGDGRKFQPGLH
jgi:hypothetical protein